MMNDDLLIQRYLDGRLTNDELAAFQHRLREDAAMREHLRLISEHAVAFGDMARRETGTLVSGPIPKTDRRAELARQAKPIWFTTLALAACLALLAASVSLLVQSKPQAVLTVVEHNGSVAWKSGVPIQTGDELPAGSLETIGEESSALLRFADGSLISLEGEAELSFADDGQKVLALSRGTLSAEVQKQPTDRPMLVRTSSAEAQVVGTVFNLSARSDDTLLKVDEGLVKLKRLADGSTVDVPAKSSAVASLNSGMKLNAAPTPEPLTDWVFDFTTTVPPRDWRGFSDGTRMVATPFVAKKLPDGGIITHFGISVRTAMLPQPLRLLATESSVIHYRLKLDKPAPLQFMLVTNRPGGSYGGNFECRLDSDEIHPGPDGWCEIAIPISRYEPIPSRPHVRKRYPTPAGNLITSAIISSFREDRHLELSHFKLTSRP
jgi:ferric-dicitrate binding protein FerR (iron transport regulator)